MRSFYKYATGTVRYQEKNATYAFYRTQREVSRLSAGYHDGQFNFSGTLQAAIETRQDWSRADHISSINKRTKIFLEYNSLYKDKNHFSEVKWRINAAIRKVKRTKENNKTKPLPLNVVDTLL